jgi:hypothetical protein
MPKQIRGILVNAVSAGTLELVLTIAAQKLVELREWLLTSDDRNFAALVIRHAV